MTDRLEAAGLVKRNPDPHDRHKTLIEPTAEGLARISDYYAGLNAQTREVLPDFTDDQLNSVPRFVEAACTATQDEIDHLSARHPQSQKSQPPAGDIALMASCWTWGRTRKRAPVPM